MLTNELIRDLNTLDVGSVQPTAHVVEWHEYGKGSKLVQVAIDPKTGAVLCAVGVAEGAPLECFSLQEFRSIFLTREQARAYFEKWFKESESDCAASPSPIHAVVESLLPILQAILASKPTVITKKT